MRLLIILSLISSGSVSFGYSLKRGSGVVDTTPTPNPSPFVGYVRFFPKHGFAKESEKKIIEKMSSIIDETVHSECFKDFILKTRIIQTNGRTNQQVLDHILSLRGEVPVSMYYRCYGRWPCTSAVAFRAPPKVEINMNRAYFTEKLSLCEWASTVGHEGLAHALGNYEHSFKWNKDRDFSVPYTINRGFEACCK